MMEELDKIKCILIKENINFSIEKDEFHFKILKRKIKIWFNNNKIITSILDYDGLHPLCHVSFIEKDKRGNMCLENNINSYWVTSFKENYLKIIEDIILESNHLEDSFNELQFNIHPNLCYYQKYLNVELLLTLRPSYNIYNNLNNIQKREIKWNGFRFRNYKQLVSCLVDQKINWQKDNLIIFYYKKREKWIFVPKIQEEQTLNFIYFVQNICVPQTLMYKTGATIKENTLVVIAGLGSLGSEIFERFRLAGYINYFLVDHDKLESNNDYRWAYPFIPWLKPYYNVFKVQLIKNYFHYLNIQIFMKKIEKITLSEINLNEFKTQINELIFIDSTVNLEVQMESLKLWYDFSKSYNFKQSTYKLVFLEQHGLSLHTFSINYLDNDYPSYRRKLKTYSKNWTKHKILKYNRKYVFQKGCVGETQIYSQNSTKNLTINSKHLWQDTNKEDYTKINILNKLLIDKKDEWSDYYKKYENEETDEIDW